MITGYTSSIIEVTSNILNNDYTPTKTDYDISTNWDFTDLETRLIYAKEYLNLLPKVKDHILEVIKVTEIALKNRDKDLENIEKEVQKAEVTGDKVVKELEKKPVNKLHQIMTKGLDVNLKNDNSTPKKDTPISKSKEYDDVFTKKNSERLKEIEGCLKTIFNSNNIRDFQPPFVRLIEIGDFDPSFLKVGIKEYFQLVIKDIKTAKKDFKDAYLASH